MDAIAAPTLTAAQSSPKAESRVREPWIDWVRVGAAIGIVALHVTAREKYRRAGTLDGFEWGTLAVYETLTRIAVPLFFMISGYLILRRCEDGKSELYAWRRTVRILAVTVFWTLAFAVWEMIKGNNDSILGFLTNAIYSKPYYHLWFLFAIAGSYFFAPLLAPGLFAIRQRYGLWLGWGLPIAVSTDYVIYQVQQHDNFYRTSVLSICVPYLAYTCAGYLLARDEHSSTRLAWIAYVTGVAGCLVTFWLLSSIAVQEADRKVFFPLSPFVVIMALGAYSLLSNYRSRFAPLPRWAKRFAQDSMGIYILHPIVLDIVNHLGLMGRRPNSFIGIAITTTVVVALTWVAVTVFRKFYVTRLTVTM